MIKHLYWRLKNLLLKWKIKRSGWTDVYRLKPLEKEERYRMGISTISDEQYMGFKQLSFVEKTIQVCKAEYILKSYCKMHPTCEGCSFRKEHIGCEFRGKSPREW